MRLRLFTLIGIALLPGVAAAQFAGVGGVLGQNTFSISVAPQYPTPYGQAVLTFVSSDITLSNATVAVSVAGKKIYDGSVGPVSVQMGRAGAPIVVTAVVTNNGAKTTQTVTIRPEDVSLIVEPISSAPPLYPGKPAVPLEGSVRVVAVANLRDAKGKAIDPLAVSYAWTVDGTHMNDASGIGKQAVLVASPLQFRSREVTVAVTSQDGTLVGGDTITLNPEDPTVRIYQSDPLLGIRFDHALSDAYTISSAEATLYAAPFSFALTSGAPSLAWFLDSAPAQSGSLITLRPTGTGGGSAQLSVTATGGGVETASASLSLTFGKTQSSNFFGL